MSSYTETLGNEVWTQAPSAAAYRCGLCARAYMAGEPIVTVTDGHTLCRPCAEDMMRVALRLGMRPVTIEARPCTPADGHDA